jgi:hypothetical protein
VSYSIARRSRRRLLVETLALATLAPLATLERRAAAAQDLAAAPDGAAYTAYVPAALKQGQFYQYSCEFDASWVVLKTFGHDASFEEQLAIVGHDTSIEPYSTAGDTGILIYGGDITTKYSGDYTSNLLARTSGSAMLPLFAHYGLPAGRVDSREKIEKTLDQGGLVWTKATVDFIPGEASTWITPSGKTLPTVYANDHAVVVMGYNDAGVVIRDVLGPTNTNWERPYEYDVPWESFLSIFASQGNDGVGVLPPGSTPAPQASEPAPDSQSAQPVQVCC